MGHHRLYTDEQIKHGIGTAGRSKKSIRAMLNGEKQDRTPVAYKPFDKIPKRFAAPERQAERVKFFFKKYLTHTAGKWKTKCFRLLPWQIDLIDRLFSKLKKNKLRQYKQAYLEIAKKNGKTEFAAGIGIYLLVWDNEGSPEIAIAAQDRNQASICFQVAAQMVRQNEPLSATLKILKSSKKLYNEFNNGVLEVVSSETASKHGYNLSGLIFDELHAQKTPDLYKVLTEGSGAAREQPLFLFLTTAGWDRNSICWKVHEMAERVKKQPEIDPTFLPIIYSMPEGADWHDETNWGAPNPSLGIIFDIENLREGFNKAKEIPSFENDFRRLRLNEWTQQQVRWLSIEKWDACKGKINIELLQKKACYGGLDLSSTQDITALILIFPSEEEYVVLCFFFCPEENIIPRSHRDKIPYELWEKQGLLIATPGDIIDYGFVLEKIKECKKLYDLKEIAFDRARATELTQKLIDEGITIVPISQSQMQMNSPIVELEKLILGKKLNHGGDPILRWMCNNVALKKNAGGLVMFDKEKANEKIDGMVALAMAVDRAMRHPLQRSALLILGEKRPDSEQKVENIEEIPEKKQIKNQSGKPQVFCPRCEKETEDGTPGFCFICGMARINRGDRNEI
jgi:phage terminase large subunit-like protein